MKKISFTKKLIVAFFAAVFVLLCSCSARTQGLSSSDPVARAFAQANMPLLSRQMALRDFTLPTLEGELLTVSDLRGKVVFVNFWATWCPPCRDEMPSMEALYQRFKDRDFEILAVNIGETPEEVTAFMEEYGFSFPALLDEDIRVGNDYGIRAIPTSFFVNQEGRIIMRKVGYLDWDTPEVHAAMELLLN